MVIKSLRWNALESVSIFYLLQNFIEDTGDQTNYL